VTTPVLAPNRRERLGGTAGNEVLTGTTAGVLVALLIAEGITIIWMGGLRTEHMFIGLVLIPPVLLKLASTGYRFARYYLGASAYREKGPPLLPLRLLAPVLVATTVLVFATGVTLLVMGHRSDLILELHKVGFIVWGAVFAVHFLWHLPRAWRAIGSAWSASRAEQVPGSLLRGLLLSTSVGVGVALALVLLSTIERWHRG
jgi:hypothetical protein